MKTSNQRGFTTIEMILGLILVSIIGFTGFYVYHANKTSSVVTKPLSDNTYTSADALADKSRTVPIKELGISLTLKQPIATSSYTVSSDGSTISFTDPAFTRAVQSCNDPGSPAAPAPTFGEFTDVPGRYDPDAMPVDVFSQFVKQFPEFYVTLGAPDGGYCHTTDQQKITAVNSLFTQYHNDLKQAALNAKLL